MPITVECGSCHQRFKAGDKLAGRTVKCPRCGEAIQVTPDASPEEDDDGGLYALAGESPPPPGSQPCPNCGKPLKPGAVVCLECGFNLSTGQRLERQVAAPTCRRCGRVLTERDTQLAGDRRICRNCRAEDIEMSSVSENDVSQMVAWIPGGPAVHIGCGGVALVFAVVMMTVIVTAPRPQGAQGDPWFGYFLVISAIVTGVALLASAGRKLRARYIAGYTQEELTKTSMRTSTIVIRAMAVMFSVFAVVTMAVAAFAEGGDSPGARLIVVLVFGVPFGAMGALLWWRAPSMARAAQRRKASRCGP